MNRIEMRIPSLKTYEQDGRLPINRLYQQFLKLTDFGWEAEIIYPPAFQKDYPPIIFLKTPNEGPALWVIAGIHGEEPAGPNTIAQNIEIFIQLQRNNIPVVLFPLCNPLGYASDSRYLNLRRPPKSGEEALSVGDSDHLLLDPHKPSQPRIPAPSSPEARALTTGVLKVDKTHPVRAAFDLHEDEDTTADPLDPYIYSHGILGAKDPIALKTIKILEKKGFSFTKQETRLGEKIENGIVPPVADGSIDELLSAQNIIYQGKVIDGPSARSVIVVETSTAAPLKTRVEGHAAVLKSSPQFWQIVNSGF